LCCTVRRKTVKEQGAGVVRRQIEKMLGLYNKKGDCEGARSWCCEKTD